MLKKNSKPKFLAVDFYCGAGGATRGLLDAGGYVIAGVDKDRECRSTYQSNNPNLTLDRATPAFLAKNMFAASAQYPHGQQAEIQDHLAELISTYKAQTSDTPMLFTICAPCQAFNKFIQPVMTAKKTVARDRDLNLLPQSVVFVEAFKPDMVLCENISGIEQGKYGYVWKNFISDLRRMGYTVGRDEVCASKFGVAQRRRRSIIFALKSRYSARATFDLQIPTEAPGTEEKTVRDAIGGLDPIEPGGRHPTIPNHECRNLSLINRSRLVAVPPGESNVGFPEELQLPCHRRMSEKGSGKRGFGDVYTRLHPDRPAGTLTTRFHSISNGRFGHYDPVQARGISFREGALLQSFGLSYEFHSDSGDAIAKMVGNAVPPKLAQFMAQSLYELWKTHVADGEAI